MLATIAATSTRCNNDGAIAEPIRFTTAVTKTFTSIVSSIINQQLADI